VALGLLAACAARRDAEIEIEVEETITTTGTVPPTTVPRGPAPGWERRGDR
jgi:hypothetical protein